MALPWPLFSRSRVSMSSRMSATIFSSRDLAGQHLLHRAPALLELRLGQIGQALGLGLEPLVDLRLRGDALVDVARLVAQVEHHAVLHRLVELVGVDVAAKDLDALLLVGLQQRRAGEADEHGVRQDRLHRLVQLAGLGAVALVHEDVEVALGLEAGRQGLLHLLDVAGDVADLFAVLLAAELVDQRAEQPGRRWRSAWRSGPRRSWCGRCPR